MPRSISLALCFSLVACDESLNGINYYGEPLLEMSGEVLSESVVGALDGELRIALLWSLPGVVELQAESSAELEMETIINWSMNLYHPPDESLYQEQLSEGMNTAIGLPVLYIDADGSQTWNDEWILGGSSSTFVFYLEGELPMLPGGAPDEGEIPEEGYNVVIPPDCNALGPVPIPRLSDPNRVSLEIGDLFFDSLPDTNCDGETNEWLAMCEHGCGVP